MSNTSGPTIESCFAPPGNPPGVTHCVGWYKLTGATLTFTGNATNLTITVGPAGETLHAGGGADTIDVTAATIGATIDGGSGRSTLVVNGGGNAVIGSNISNIAAVTLKAATNFTAKALNLTITGSSSAATITAGGSTQTLTSGLGADTLTGFNGGGDTSLDKTANLDGDIIQNFAAAGDRIDITDIKALGASLTFTGNILKLTNGALSASITLTGTFTQSDFTLGHDPKGNVLITQTGGNFAVGATQTFVQAMAGLGADAAAYASPVDKTYFRAPPMLAAASHAAWA